MPKSARVLMYLGLAIAGLLMWSKTGFADDDIQQWIDARIAEGNDLAIVAAVMDGDDIRYFSGGVKTPEGDAPDENTQFQIGSITKVFTNLMLAEMVNDGDVNYSTTVADLEGDGFSPINRAVGDITLRELSTHTSGLPRMPDNMPLGDPLDPYGTYTTELMDAAIRNARHLQPLANDYAYSNFGLGYLGYALGRNAGDGYTATVNDMIISPLGLEETGFEPGDNLSDGFRNGEVVPDWTFQESITAAGGLWSSTSDLMRVARAAMGLSDSPLSQTFGSTVDVVDRVDRDFDISPVWHLAWADDEPIYWHNGGTGGFVSFFGFRPDTQQAVAILVAGGSMPMRPGFEYLGMTRREPVKLNIDTTVFGEYELIPGLSIGVFERGGRLYGQVTGQPPALLYDAGDDWYAINIADASVRFVREDGEVTTLELAQNGILQPARRVAAVASAANQPDEVAIDDSNLDDFVGEYTINAAAKFTIRRAGDGLEAQITGQPYLPIFYKGDDIFFYKVVEAELRFERNDNGEINALVLHQGAIVQRSPKVQ